MLDIQKIIGMVTLKIENQVGLKRLMFNGVYTTSLARLFFIRYFSASTLRYPAAPKAALVPVTMA
jgi:hypothetical protein